MTPPVTDEQVAEIERLANAATPGGWEYHSHPVNEIIDGRLSVVYCISVEDGTIPFVTIAEGKVWLSTRESAEFIVAVRNLLPAFIARIRADGDALDAANQTSQIQQAFYNSAMDRAEVAERARDDWRAKAERLHAALSTVRDFSGHDPECNDFATDYGDEHLPCSCGYQSVKDCIDAALSAAPETKGK